MKKYFLIVILGLLLAVKVFAAPSSTMSITPAATDGTTITASDENTRNNAISTTYNAHSHTDITRLSIIDSGVWQSTNIGTAYGGTGRSLNTTAQGSIIYFSATGQMDALSAGTSGYVLGTQGAGANPIWVAPSSTTKVGSFTIDISTTGTQAVTGVGFQPSAVILMAGNISTEGGSIGVAAGAAMGLWSQTQAGIIDVATTAVIRLYVDGSNYNTSTLTSFDSDGFTITKSKTSSPTGTATVAYLAIK